MPGRFTLWAMRARVHALGQGMCPPGVLAPAFGRMGILAALPDFHMGMAFFNRDALEKLAHDLAARLDILGFSEGSNANKPGHYVIERAVVG